MKRPKTASQSLSKEKFPLAKIVSFLKLIFNIWHTTKEIY